VYKEWFTIQEVKQLVTQHQSRIFQHAVETKREASWAALEALELEASARANANVFAVIVEHAAAI
jgi:hypothetical protein